MPIRPRDRFSKTLQLTAAEISAFAHAVDDHNPLHHDREFAVRSKNGGIIASGTQTSSLLMGFAASYFSRTGTMVGLEFTFFFRAAVPAGDLLTLEWFVVRVESKEKLQGDLVELRGRLKISSGLTAVGAKGKVLVSGVVSASLTDSANLDG